MLSRLLSIKTPTKIILSASTAPRAKNHLLQVPPKGGRPITLKLPIKNASIVMGMARPMPRISLMFVLWVAVIIAPAQKNNVILPKAWVTRCKPPPVMLAVVASAAPSSIYES